MSVLDAVPEAVMRLGKILPRFPDGRVDYTHATEAPVLDVFVMYDQKLLLLKRSEQVGWLKGRWHIIAGFLDDEKTLREKILEEMLDETQITPEYVGHMHAVEPFYDNGAKLWLVHPALVTLAKEPKIVLDWESTEYTWIDPSALASYDVTPNVHHMHDLLTRP